MCVCLCALTARALVAQLMWWLRAQVLGSFSTKIRISHHILSVLLGKFKKRQHCSPCSLEEEFMEAFVDREHAVGVVPSSCSQRRCEVT